MKLITIFLLFVGSAGAETKPKAISKLPNYDLSDHAKSGRAESRSYVKVNQPIRANHPLSRK